MSERWKDLERTVARKLRGRRVPRWLDFGVSAPDVLVPDFPELVIDTKAYRRFAHHTMLEVIAGKYCEPGEIPVLVTKAEGQRGEYVTIPLDWFAELLDKVRGDRDNGTTDVIHKKRSGGVSQDLRVAT